MKQKSSSVDNFRACDGSWAWALTVTSWIYQSAFTRHFSTPALLIIRNLIFQLLDRPQSQWILYWLSIRCDIHCLKSPTNRPMSYQCSTTSTMRIIVGGTTHLRKARLCSMCTKVDTIQFWNYRGHSTHMCLSGKLMVLARAHPSSTRLGLQFQKRPRSRPNIQLVNQYQGILSLYRPLWTLGLEIRMGPMRTCFEDSWP